MKNRPVQSFSNERLKADRSMSKEQIAEFLDDFQSMVHGDEGPRKLISLRVPEKLLHAFKEKARRKEIAYQTRIVELMREWVGR